MTIILSSFTRLLFRVYEEEEAWPSSEYINKMRSCLLYQREKDVPCQFLNIELPGCIWFLEYNLISIFTCLKKDTDVLDIRLPSSGVANLPTPLRFYLARRCIICTMSQKKEDNHDSHQAESQLVIFFCIKEFGSSSKTCLSIAPSPHPSPVAMAPWHLNSLEIADGSRATGWPRQSGASGSVRSTSVSPAISSHGVNFFQGNPTSSCMYMCIYMHTHTYIHTYNTHKNT